MSDDCHPDSGEKKTIEMICVFVGFFIALTIVMVGVRLTSIILYYRKERSQRARQRSRARSRASSASMNVGGVELASVLRHLHLRLALAQV